MGVSRFFSEAFGGERSTKTFTCYKLLSRIQEPFLFVKRHAVIQSTVAARRSELAYRSGHARQLIAAEVQHPQRRELPDLRRQARQLIVAEVQLPQRRELPDLRRHAPVRLNCQRELQHRQQSSACPILRLHVSASCPAVQGTRSQ